MVYYPINSYQGWRTKVSEIAIAIMLMDMQYKICKLWDQKYKSGRGNKRVDFCMQSKLKLLLGKNTLVFMRSFKISLRVITEQKSIVNTPKIEQNQSLLLQEIINSQRKNSKRGR